MAMEIRPLKITCKDLAEGFVDNDEEGVKGYGGKLDIRPPYQREFIYGEKDRDAVITTIYNGYPLNVMYWADRGDGTYEIIDGQQRTISICQYICGKFSYNLNYFHNIKDPVERDKVLNYPLMIYVCAGTDTEKLRWFETINIRGKELTKQELRNAVYHGSFVTDAKRYFSKNNCPAYNVGRYIVSGTPNRQDYLQTALEWICYAQKLKQVENYMAIHQNDNDAVDLWNYFYQVVTWVSSKFDVSKRSKYLKSTNWGYLYEKYHNDKTLDKAQIEKEFSQLLKDSEVENNNGIPNFIFTRDERYLGLRTFGDDIRERVYEKQGGICRVCGKHFELSEMEADHIKPWSKGGKTEEDNCQMLCMKCNRTKSNK